jgi:hypothetical protein
MLMLILLVHMYISLSAYSVPMQDVSVATIMSTPTANAETRKPHLIYCLTGILLIRTLQGSSS